MPALLLLALLSAAPSTRSERWAKPDARDRRLSRIIQTVRAIHPPLFQFADVNGTGMGTACACSSVTGTQGEAITFTRASNGACTKGGETAGIANGDIVFCSTNQPRVMPGGAGTGPLGLSMWVARTNFVSDSQDFSLWTASGSVAAAPTVIVSDGGAIYTAPDNTFTAQRVQFAATDGTLGGNSTVTKAGSCSGTPTSAGVYARGMEDGGSGTIAVCMDTGTVSESVCTKTAFNSSTWTRLLRENATSKTRMSIGTVSDLAGGNSMAAADVYLWQADCQTGITMSPPIVTSGGSATRAVEHATAAVSSGTNTSRSVAATVVVDSVAAQNRGGVYWTKTANSDEIQAVKTSSAGGIAQCSLKTGTTTNVNSVAGVTTNSANRISCDYDQNTIHLILNGTIASGSVAATMGVYTTVYLGETSAGSVQVNGVLKLVCVDNTLEGCR